MMRRTVPLLSLLLLLMGLVPAMGLAEQTGLAELIGDRSLLMLQVHAQSAADVPEIREALRRGYADVVDFAKQQATCPAGKVSQSWTPALARGTTPVIKIKYAVADCGLKALGIKEGTEMSVREERGRYIVEPVEKTGRKIDLTGIAGSLPGIERLPFEERIRDWKAPGRG